MLEEQHAVATQAHSRHSAHLKHREQRCFLAPRDLSKSPSEASVASDCYLWCTRHHRRFPFSKHVSCVLAYSPENDCLMSKYINIHINDIYCNLSRGFYIPLSLEYFYLCTSAAEVSTSSVNESTFMTSPDKSSRAFWAASNALDCLIAKPGKPDAAVCFGKGIRIIDGPL